MKTPSACLGAPLLLLALAVGPGWPGPVYSAANASAPRTIAVVADSTAADSQDWAVGWGSLLGDYFDQAKITVKNFSSGGVSSRAFMERGRWQKVMAQLRPGDFVLLQFSHGESQPLDAPNSIGTLPGSGEEIQAVAGGAVVHSYGWYIRKYIADARQLGCQPILLTSTVRNQWQGGVLTNDLDAESYNRTLQGIGAGQNVPVIDLHRIIENEYLLLGLTEVKKFFPRDRNHTNRSGAALTASLIIAGWKDLPAWPFTNSLSALGATVEPASLHPRPAGAQAMPVPQNPALPSLYLVGDSAVRAGVGNGAGGQWGWGDPLAGCFDLTKVNVVNRGVAEASTRTYRTRGYWGRLLLLLKPGDLVLIQFGHADDNPLENEPRSAGTLPGIGDETIQIKVTPRSAPEDVHTYGWYLKRFVAEVRQAGAIPILCSPTPANHWVDGKIVRCSGTYAAWTKAVAQLERVDFIDLNARVAPGYDRLGPKAASRLFTDPEINTSLAGAEGNARAVVAGFQALQPNPVGSYLKP
jgi:lysophospholipase L1-like esterase